MSHIVQISFGSPDRPEHGKMVLGMPHPAGPVVEALTGIPRGDVWKMYGSRDDEEEIRIRVDVPSHWSYENVLIRRVG